MNKIWACSPLSFKHNDIFLVSVRRSTPRSYLYTWHHSNIGVHQIRARCFSVFLSTGKNNHLSCAFNCVHIRHICTCSPISFEHMTSFLVFVLRSAPRSYLYICHHSNIGVQQIVARGFSVFLGTGKNNHLSCAFNSMHVPYMCTCCKDITDFTCSHEIPSFPLLVGLEPPIPHKSQWFWLLVCQWFLSHFQMHNFEE